MRQGRRALSSACWQSRTDLREPPPGYRDTVVQVFWTRTIIDPQMRPQLHVLQADITTLDVDVIVNAANSSLLGGGGVDGAIHRAAGPDLLRECEQLGGCSTGDAKMTSGYRLRARHVIHAVGPVWRGGDHGEPELLASCYRRALELAGAHGLATIAFPSISTGVYGYPIREAASIAVRTVTSSLEDHPTITDVTFCCFSEKDGAVYREALDAVAG